MSSFFHVIIPARYQSSRLPGKLLEKLGNQTVLERTFRQAEKARPASLLIATDHQLITEHARQFTSHVIMTSSEHNSGTDRLAEAIRLGNYQPKDIIVNVQGDEPFMDPLLISQVATALYESNSPMATLCWPITTLEEFHDPNVVKVVRSKRDEALYFSRSPIPMHRDKSEKIHYGFRHIGLYAYRAAFLEEFTQLEPALIESCEMLEQLRVLAAGYSIKVEQACCPPQQDINCQADLEYAREFCLRDNNA